jgi:hypothetical protein
MDPVAAAGAGWPRLPVLASRTSPALTENRQDRHRKAPVGCLFQSATALSTLTRLLISTFLDLARRTLSKTFLQSAREEHRSERGFRAIFTLIMLLAGVPAERLCVG